MSAPKNSLPPGSYGLPLIGETLQYVKNPRAFVEKRRAKYGPVFRSHVFFAKTLFFTGAVAVDWVLAGENKYLQGKWIAPVARLLGKSSSTMLSGDEHLRRRRLLAPVFSYASLRPFVPRIQQIARKHFEQRVGTTFDAIELFRGITFEVIAKLAIDEDRLDLDFLSSRFENWTAGMFSPFPIKNKLFPFGKALHARSEILSYLMGIIQDRKEAQERPEDLLSRLLDTRDEEGNPMEDDAIANEIVLQLFAGHETSVTTLSNLTLMLHENPAVWAKLTESLEGQPDVPSLDAFRGMKYLTWTIQEGMRIIPPVAGAFREMTQDKVYEGMDIPKGWTLMYNVHSVHHDKTWADSDNFDPERYNPETREVPGRKSLVPFGGGGRSCLGQHLAMVEMSAVLYEMVRSYHWKLLPGQDLSYAFIPFPLPKKGIHIQLERRNTEGSSAQATSEVASTP